MAFSNTVFLFIFLPSVLLLYYILPGKTPKNSLLTVTSVIFYAYGEPFAVFLMLLSVLINYLFGLYFGKTGKRKKIMLTLAVTANLLILGTFKYADFAVDILNTILPVSIPKPGIALPIGISFFTFQAMSYVIDVYRQPDTVQRNPFRLLLYIAFFPQLIAGPIVKYHDFDHQISDRKIDTEKLCQGIRRFIIGLAKKLLISNQMAIAADRIYGLDMDTLSAPAAWIGAIAYMMQIYYDFSGYSDMAIGLGKMFGFDIQENFNYPYISSSVSEFWRRWHISLSSWFREYLYIPLGGNRRSPARVSFNLMMVFFCTGLWHGAALHFVIWGVLNGIFVVFESRTGLFKKKKIKVIGNIYTFLVALTAFVFFRSETTSGALKYIKAMFTGFSFNGSAAIAVSALTPLFIISLAAAFLFMMPVKGLIEEKVKTMKCGTALNYASYALSLGLLLICMVVLSSATYNPFIYYRF